MFISILSQHLCDTHVEQLARWLSCNGEVWGVGPTAVFASAAALFLFNELEATLFIVGDQANISLLEKTLVVRITFYKIITYQLKGPRYTSICERKKQHHFNSQAKAGIQDP